MRYVRSFLLALTTFSFFLLALVAALYAYITPERVSARVSAILSRHLALEATPGNISITQRLPNLKFTVSNITLTNADAAVTGTVGEASVVMHPFAFFARSPRIDEIIVSDGAMRFSNTSPEALREWLGTDASALPFDLKKLVLARSALYFTTAGSTEPWAYVNNLSGTFADMNETGATAALKGVVKLPDLLGTAEVAGIADWSQGLLKSDVRVFNATFKGDVRGSAADLHAKADALHLMLDDLTLSNAGLIFTNASGTTAEFTAPVLTMNTKRLEAPTISAALTLSGHRITADSPIVLTLPEGRLEAPALTLRLLSDTLDGNLCGSLLWKATDGEGRLEMNGNVGGTPLTTNLIFSVAAPTTTEGVPFSHAIAGETLLTGRVVLGEIDTGTLLQIISAEKILRNLKIDLDINVAIRAPLIGTHETKGRLTADAGHFRFVNGIMTFTTGDALLDAELRQDRAWRVDGRWDSLDGADIAPHLLTGRLAGNLTASGHADTPKSTRLVATLNAHQGTISGADLQSATRIMRDEQPEELPTEAFLRQSTSHFTALACRVSFENGAWRIEDGTAEGHNWNATFAGPVALLTGTTDINNSDGSLFFTMPLRLQTNPVFWTPDWRSAQISAKNHAGELPMSFKTLKNHAVRRLENWWNNFDPSSMTLPELDLPNLEMLKRDLPDWAPEFLKK